MRRLLYGIVRSLYRRLYKVRELHEHYEAYLVSFELALILVGLLTFFLHDWHVLWDRDAHSWQAVLIGHWKEWCELAIFAFLFLSMTARLVILLRRGLLGYNFTQLLSLRDARGRINFDQIFREILQTQPGFAPCQTMSIPTVADLVAAASAGSFSERDLRGSEDDIWFQRERDYLIDWLTDFPRAVWYLPAGLDTPAGDFDGYASVMLPVTRFSARTIRKGHRATDTAELDPDVVAILNDRLNGVTPTQSASEDKKTYILAYAQLRVSSAGAPVAEAQKLLAVSVQHLAVLLSGRFGTEGEIRRRWNFVVFCEAANRRQEELLLDLGFEHHPSRSFAGFPLMQLTVERGEPVNDDRRVEAARFLEVLEQCVRIVPARLSPVH